LRLNGQIHTKIVLTCLKWT